MAKTVVQPLVVAQSKPRYETTTSLIPGPTTVLTPELDELDEQIDVTIRSFASSEVVFFPVESRTQVQALSVSITATQTVVLQPVR